MLIACATPAAALDFGDIADRARARAQHPYQPNANVPSALAQLDYDAYRAIEFRAEKTLWPESDFGVQFFSPGYLFKKPVTMHVVQDGDSEVVPFEPSWFDFGGKQLAAELPADVGYAGFRLHYQPRESSAQPARVGGEVIAFLGASYFRAKGRGQTYGLSARGVAIDTLAESDEEFPAFTEFWLRRPEPGAESVEVYALLEGPSITGAYRFVVDPGQATIVDVKARLFMRADTQSLGLAPLTSMFLYGRGQPRPERYLRPAVHDSDGLLIHSGAGEWRWRPLSNPARATQDHFRVDKLRGFGLMQRNREFDSYQSLTMHYQDRPSAWLIPKGDWGSGQVTLTELPTKKETHDNIVAYWQNDDPPAAGESISLAYRLRWGVAAPDENTARVVATRRGTGRAAGTVLLLVDFSGTELNRLPTQSEVQADVTAGEGAKIIKQRVDPNPITGGRRLTLVLRPGPGMLQLRAQLMRDGKPISEIWDYVLQPPKLP